MCYSRAGGSLAERASFKVGGLVLCWDVDEWQRDQNLELRVEASGN